MRYSWNAPRKPTPKAIGIGSHLIFVFPRAAPSRDLKDSFRCCCSWRGREEEKLREGTGAREYAGWKGGACRRRVEALMSWREQIVAMSTSSAQGYLYNPILVYYEFASKTDGGQKDDERALCEKHSIFSSANDVAATATAAAIVRRSPTSNLSFTSSRTSYTEVKSKWSR